MGRGSLSQQNCADSYMVMEQQSNLPISIEQKEHFTRPQ